MPALRDVARKAFNISRTRFNPAFSGVNGQILHDDGDTSADGAMRVAAVWIANSVIADEVSSLVMKIIRRGDTTREPIRHPSLRVLWDRPNPDQTVMGWQATNSLSLTLHGVSYNMLGWTRSGSLDVVWPLPPTDCTLERMDDLGLRLNVSGMGTLENHPGQRPEFMFIPLYQLPGQIQPVSPIRYAAELLGLARQYDATAKSLAARGFNPSAIVTIGEAIPDEVAEKFGARLARLHSGSTRAGGVAVIGGPNIKVERWAMTLADAQFVAQSERVFNLLMAIWRVPPTVAGMVDKPSTWGSGVAEFSRGLERFTLRPIVERLQAGYEAYMTRWVDEDLQVRLKFDSLLSASPRDRMEIQRLSLVSGMTSLERVLAQNDEPPFAPDETIYTQLSAASEADRDIMRRRQMADTLSVLVNAGVPIERALELVGMEPLGGIDVGAQGSQSAAQS